MFNLMASLSYRLAKWKLYLLLYFILELTIMHFYQTTCAENLRPYWVILVWT